MKARTKVLLTSVASIAMCASIAVGGTYALFTDEAKVNVAVTSGTVDVEANIDATTLKTYSRGIEQAQGTFANDASGTTGAEIVGSELVLTNITPGDKVEFEIVVTNNSNVDIQYRAVAYVSGSLADFLVCTSSATEWKYVDGDETIAPVKVSVEFPEKVTYTDLGGIDTYNATVAFTVEAVQGNGDTGFDYRGGEYFISNAEGLFKFAETVNEGTKYAGETVKLTKDIDLENKAWTPIGEYDQATFNGMFDGQGFTISNMKLHNKDAYMVGLFGYTSGATIKNVNVKNVDFDIDQQAGAILGRAKTATTITNCHVSGTVNIVANFAYAGGIASDGYVSISNCSVIADGMGVIKAGESTMAGGIIGYLNEGANVIDNCQVENLNVTGWTCVGAIAGFTGYGTTISNSSAKNVNLTKTRLGGNPAVGLASGNWHYHATLTTTYANNTFDNISLNGTSKVYEVANVVLHGSEYAGKTDVSCLVLTNNTMTNITDNRTIYTQVNVTAGADKVANGTTLANAIAATTGATTLSLPAGEYKMPSDRTTAKEVTIVGTKDTVIDNTMGSYWDNSKVSFEGVTIKGSTGMANGNGSDYAALYCPNVTYTNCTFDGPFRVGRDGATFVNCTFTNLGNDYVWTYGNDCTFIGCTFESEGKALLIYSDGGNEVSQVTVKDCVFNATKGNKAGAISNQNCAAIEIQNYGNSVNLTVEGNTWSEHFSGQWRIKAYHSNKPAIVVNGTTYTSIALDGRLMTINDKVVTFA